MNNPISIEIPDTGMWTLDIEYTRWLSGEKRKINKRIVPQSNWNILIPGNEYWILFGEKTTWIIINVGSPSSTEIPASVSGFWYYWIRYSRRLFSTES